MCKGNARLTWQPYNIPVKAVILWKDGVSANPGLSKDEAAQEAGCYLAKAIPDYALAAEINPDDIDAQYNAALSLASAGRTEEALSHAREARRIAGGRADVLNLLAALGDLKEAPAEKVLEASFAGPISVRLGAPDAGKAYVTSRQGNRYVLSQVSLRDGGVKILADPCGWSVAVSPNGACLAYSTGLQSDVPCEVRVLDPASGKTWCIAGTTGPVLGMTWSPDSQRLAFASRDGLVAVDGDGRNRQILVSSVRRSAEDYEVPASPQWSPDGTRLLFATSMWERSGPLRVVEVDTGTIIKLTADWVGAGLWSPDGREILYTKMRPGGPGAKVYLLDDLSGNGGDGRVMSRAVARRACDQCRLGSRRDDLLLRFGGPSGDEAQVSGIGEQDLHEVLVEDEDVRPVRTSLAGVGHVQHATRASQPGGGLHCGPPVSAVADVCSYEQGSSTRARPRMSRSEPGSRSARSSRASIGPTSPASGLR